MASGKHGAGALSSIYVLGNASIDVTLNVPRLPMAGETLMAHGIKRGPGGKGLNQAVMAARAGAAVHFCAPVGREPEAAIIHRALGEESFASLHLIETSFATDLSTLIVAADSENMIVSTGDCADGLTPDIAGAFAKRVRQDDWLLVQGNLTEAATWAAISQARRIIFNTAPIRWISRQILTAASIVIANQGEAAAITGLDDPLQSVCLLGGKIGVVTLGANGCVVAEAGTVRRFPAVPVTPVDSSGAGDVFCGVLTACIALGSDLDTAIAQAQRAAAIAVCRAGCFAAFPTAAELLAVRPAPLPAL